MVEAVLFEDRLEAARRAMPPVFHEVPEGKHVVPGKVPYVLLSSPSDSLREPLQLPEKLRIQWLFFKHILLFLVDAGPFGKESV